MVYDIPMRRKLVSGHRPVRRVSLAVAMVRAVHGGSLPSGLIRENISLDRVCAEMSPDIRENALVWLGMFLEQRFSSAPEAATWLLQCSPRLAAWFAICVVRGSISRASKEELRALALAEDRLAGFAIQQQVDDACDVLLAKMSLSNDNPQLYRVYEACVDPGRYNFDRVQNAVSGGSLSRAVDLIHLFPKWNGSAKDDAWYPAPARKR